MATRKGHLLRAWELLVKSLRTKDKIKLIGADHMGNRYFEAERPNNPRRFQRYFVNEKVKEMDILDAARVPPAWDAWLRFRRQEPPSEDEVQESEEYFRNQQEMAKERASRERKPQDDSLKTQKLHKDRPVPKLPYY